MQRSIFTREEFYELVWSTPMTKLAERVDLSDVALKKTCRRHDIPTPPLGWWAKKAAGKKVMSTPLPKSKTTEVRNIVIYQGRRSQLREGLAEARAIAEAPVQPGAACKPQLQIVERTLALLRKAKVSPSGVVTIGASGIFHVSAAPASYDRIGAFLQSVAVAVAGRGWTIRSTADGVAIETPDETVGLSIAEIIDRARHVPTEAELEKLRRWEEKQTRDARLNRWSFAFDRPSIPEWDYGPSGRLQVQLEQVYVTGAHSPRRTFADGKTQTLETMLTEIILGIAVAAAAKRERKEQDERQRRHWQEMEERRREAERQAALQTRRVAVLDDVLGTIERLERVERLGKLVDETGAQAGRVQMFRSWLDSYAAVLRGSLESDGLERQLERSGCFEQPGAAEAPIR